MYFYYRNRETWTLNKKLLPSVTAVESMFGQSVAVSSTAIVTGVPRTDHSTGTAQDSGSIYINTIIDEGCGSSTSDPTITPTYFPSYNPTTKS